MQKNHWLIKSEPETYAWDAFVKEGGTQWTGVRNYAARNNMRAMKKGEPVLFYHSGDEKRIVGLARVSKEAYVDPTASEGDWSAVDFEPVKPLARPVPLQELKADKILKDMEVIRLGRLSVSRVSAEQYKRLMEQVEKKRPGGA